MFGAARSASALHSLLILLIAVLAMGRYRPIAPLAGYHHFADTRAWLGLPNAGDVLWNAGFALVGIAGLVLLWSRCALASVQPGWSGYVVFFVSVLLTALASSWYHLAPDNARPVFDHQWSRTPQFSVSAGGVLAAVWYETVGKTHWLTPALALLAVASVLWWRRTDLRGPGDLGPYLLLKGLPLALIALLPWQARRRRRDWPSCARSATSICRNGALW